MGFPLTRDDFPEHITPVMGDKLPELKQKLAGGAANSLNARENYVRLSSQIAFLTGHEFARDRQGRSYTRQEWEDVMHKCLSHLNDELMLGLDDAAVEAMTLCYTVLTEATRFGGDPVIGRRNGESTGVHSLHTMLQAQYIYQKALEENPPLSDDADFFRNFQMTCLMLAVHDLGELLGEAGSLAAAADAGNLAVKDKAAFERSVFDFAVRLAVQTVTDKKPKNEFYDRIDAVKSVMKVQNQGAFKTDEQLTAELAELMQSEIKLNNAGRGLFDFLKNAWEWIEEPGHSKYPFLGYLASACERIQGTRHLNRQLAESPGSPLKSDDGSIQIVRTSTLSPGYRIIANAQYVEGKLSSICESADKGLLRERALAEQAAARIYDTQMGLFRNMPQAFFRDPAYAKQETRLHNDGTPYTLEEVAKRKDEIALAGRVAEVEAGAIGSILRRKGKLREDFNESVLLTGRIAVTKQQVLALYQRAIDTKYLPAMNIIDGKKRSEILIVDLPERLTGVRALTESEHKKTADSIVKKTGFTPA